MKLRQLNVRVTELEYTQVQALASAMGMDVANLMRYALEQQAAAAKVPLRLLPRKVGRPIGTGEGADCPVVYGLWVQRPQHPSQNRLSRKRQ